MLLLFLPVPPPVVVLVTLALSLYLTVVELRELRPNYLWWFWWLLLVFMTNFAGYLALRAYAHFHRRAAARP